MPERIAVVTPARNELESFKAGFIDKVFNNIPSEYEPQVVVAVNNSGEEFIDYMAELHRNVPNLRVLQLGNLAPQTFAYGYLEGLNTAAEDGFDFIVEMDATGAHNPSYIPKFVTPLKEGADAAFSSRFSPGGGVDRYPLQRKIISQGGTLLSNLVLGLGQPIPDMTSGYESFRKETLKDLFGTVPIEDWISVRKGPGHFYQTEMRSYVLWRENEVAIVPMVWGTTRAKEPTKLPLKTSLAALWNLLLLRQRRAQIKDLR